MADDDGPVCPECKAGKHANCHGDAWDTRDGRDEPTHCRCWENGHQ